MIGYVKHFDINKTMSFRVSDIKLSKIYISTYIYIYINKVTWT